MSDAAVGNQLRADDDPQPALAQIIERHGNMVQRTAARLVGQAAADDVCQSVFLILMKKTASIRDAAALSSWLYQTTVLVSRTYLRTEQRRRYREKKAFEMKNMAGLQDQPAFPEQFDEALSGLPDIYRRTIVLRFLQNQTRGETAHAMGTNENTVDVRTNRALDKLRRALAGAVPGISAAVLLEALLRESTAAAEPFAAGKVAAIQAVCAGKAAASQSVASMTSAALKSLMLAKAMLAVALTLATVLLTATATVAVWPVRSPSPAAEQLPPVPPVLPVTQASPAAIFQRLVEADDPAGFVWKGVLGPGPEPEPARVCLASEHIQTEKVSLMDIYVKNPDGSPLWKFDPHLVLELDLYLDGEPSFVQLSVGGKLKEFHLLLPGDTPRRRWTRVKLPLSQLRTSPEGFQPLQGDELFNLVFTTPRTPFWIDNIAIVRNEAVHAR